MQKQYDIVEGGVANDKSILLKTTRTVLSQRSRHSVSYAIRKSTIRSAYSIRR